MAIANRRRSTMLEIEKKKYPIPADLIVPGMRRVYPFHLMEVGDSFFAPETKRSTVMTAIRTAHKKLRESEDTDVPTFAAVEITRGKKHGFRVWRIV
jgi:hypothetical protein